MEQFTKQKILYYKETWDLVFKLVFQTRITRTTASIKTK